MSENPSPSVPEDFYRVKMTFERIDAQGTTLKSCSYGARLNPEGPVTVEFVELIAKHAHDTVTAYLPDFVGEIL